MDTSSPAPTCATTDPGNPSEDAKLSTSAAHHREHAGLLSQRDGVLTTELDKHDRRAWGLTRRLALAVAADPQFSGDEHQAQACAAVSLLSGMLRRSKAAEVSDAS